MVGQLDRLLTALSEQPVDPRVAGLEPRVWAQIDMLRHAGLLPVWWRAAAATLALALGAAVGGVGASAAVPVDVMAAFSPQAALAPSTLLEGSW